MDQPSRRAFLGLVATSAASAAAAAPVGASSAARTPTARRFTGPLCFFSKHLPRVGPPELGRLVKSAGFEAVDLTVRAGGHVLPERTAADLPSALRDLRAHGVSVPMITTALTSADQGHAREILETAGREGVPCFKTGYYTYAFADVRREVADVAARVRDLAALGRQHGIVLGFHNHADNVGSSAWDAAAILDPLDPRWAGYYFDPRHAVVEGGGVAWRVAAALAAPRMKMVAVKDCVWEQRADGRWRPRDCPLGEGMVDWRTFCGILAAASFQGPISLHLEYDIPGTTPAAQIDATLEAAVRDLAAIRRYLDAAYGA
jgi:L-ribulose-5-phosphate 3-epimerase